MTNREFIANGNIKEVSSFMSDLIAHAGLCKKYCKGCKKAKYNCSEAVEKMLEDEKSEN